MSLSLTNLVGFGVGAAEFGWEYVGTSTSTTGASTYTFSSTSIGDADPTRLVVVAVASTCGTAFAALTSGTIDGSSATLVAAAGATRYSATGIIALVVPSGTAVDIAVTFDNTMEHCSISVYRLVNYGSATANDTDATNTGPATSVTCTLDIPTNGVAIFAHSHAVTGNTTFSSASEDYDADLETRRTAAAHKTVTSALSAHAESASWTGSSSGGMSAASWGP